MRPLEAMRKYAIRHYGNLVSLCEPEFDARKRIWSAELKSDYPRIIRDDRMPSERILKFLTLRRLGTISLGEDLQYIEATPRDLCIQNMTDFLKMWEERAERIIIRASSPNLARINEAQWVLAKIGMIISNLLQKDRITHTEIESHLPKEGEKIRRYLDLLEGLGLVERYDEGYTYGPLFTQLRRGTSSSEEFRIAVLTHVIRERYLALRETFGISQLETFVHADSCYYRPALEAERVIYQERHSLINSYVKLYGRKSPLRLTYILGELVRVKALEYEDNFYFGNEPLFSEMLEYKSRMEEIAPLRA